MELPKANLGKFSFLPPLSPPDQRARTPLLLPRPSYRYAYTYVQSDSSKKCITLTSPEFVAGDTFVGLRVKQSATSVIFDAAPVKNPMCSLAANSSRVL